MKTTLQVMDDFLPDPFSARKWAMEQDWDVAPEFQGAKYQGCIPLDPAQWQLADLVQQAHGSPVKISLAFARMALANEPTPAWIHSDTSVDEYAGVLYLSRPNYCVGGTAFWHHNELGWDRVPDAKELERQGVVWNQDVADRLNHDAQDTKHWTMTGLVPMKYNRFLSYPSKLFHSRWPKEAFGSSYDNGRLIVACFYSPV